MIESVPNCSEGVHAAVVEAMADAVRGVPGVLLLNHSADASHNRSVYTLVGDAGVLIEALVRLVEVAIRRIDLRGHRGVHPRMGAVDVVPFIPLQSATLAECVELSRTFGALVAERFGLPVFLYEASATLPYRRRLEDVRRGEFEGLTSKLRQPEWRPDFGPLVPHPTAGALITGARMPLIAFNINLASNDVAVARQIARAVRERDGGLPCVKALGLPLAHRHVAQVSMNLTDFTVTSVQTVFDAVQAEARKHGVDVLESELIGLIPAAALEGTTPEALRLAGFTSSQILEHRMAELLTSGS